MAFNIAFYRPIFKAVVENRIVVSGSQQLPNTLSIYIPHFEVNGLRKSM